MYIRNKTYLEFMEWIKQTDQKVQFMVLRPYVKDNYYKFIKSYQAVQSIYPNCIYYLRGMDIIISSNKIPTKKDFDKGYKKLVEVIIKSTF
ncbi:MAG: hypothetical protein ACRCRT_05140 [Cetobacterium somerae]